MRNAAAARLDVEGDVPRPPSSAIMLTLRVPAEWIAEAQQLAPALSRPGMSLTKSDVLRLAIAQGMVALRAEVEAKANSSPNGKRSKK